MFFCSAEMDVEFMEMLEEGAERCTFSHFGKGIDIFREALASVAALAVRARHVGVRVVDVAREQNTRMHLAPVGSHLFAVLAAGVEIGDFVRAEHIVHVLGQLGLQWRHDGEFLTHKNLSEQVVRAGEDHRLLLEILNRGAFG